MARIYLSSTFLDLKEERQKARDAINALEHLPVAMETYTASEERPLERCLKDVQSCQGYIGIFAWRYGYIPQPHQKSITHLEYEEAGRLRIPRLIFLLDEQVPWPAERRENDPRLLQLRQHLGTAHTTARFSSVDDLRAKVTAAVSYHFGTGRPIPELLPYLLDRSRQEDEIERALANRRRSRPLSLIVHGDELQCHEKFLDRLVERALPRFLGLDAMQTRITPYELVWPTQAESCAELDRRLLANLGEAVHGRRSATIDDIQGHLARHPGPVVLHSYVLARELRQLGTGAIEAFTHFFARWPLLVPCQQLFVVLSVKYGIAGSPGLLARLGLRWHQRSIEDLLEAESREPRKLSAAVLSRIQGVERGDAEAWARNETREFLRTDGDRLLPQIREIYASWEAERDSGAIPMEKLAEELRKLLHGHCLREGSLA